MILKTQPPLASPQKEKIQSYFDSVSKSYDFINSFLSFRMDEGWRKKALDKVLDDRQKSILDLGLGTGKFLMEALKRKSWEQAVGLDFSQGMLENAKRKIKQPVEFVRGDFHHLPFQGDRFDLILSAFTLRSVKDMPRFLSEAYRVLKPNGKAAFLCLTRPRNLLMRLLYYPYLNFYLPTVGRFISGDREAYQFLSQSIRHFQKPEETAAMMTTAGFRGVEIIPYSFGIATLIVGEK